MTKIAFYVALVLVVIGFNQMRADEGKEKLPLKRLKDDQLYSTTGEMTSRIMSIKWHAATNPDQWTITCINDENDEDAVLALVEFNDGSLGIAVAHQRADHDRCLIIKKPYLKKVDETIKRMLSPF